MPPLASRSTSWSSRYRSPESLNENSMPDLSTNGSACRQEIRLSLIAAHHSPLVYPSGGGLTRTSSQCRYLPRGKDPMSECNSVPNRSREMDEMVL